MRHRIKADKVGSFTPVEEIFEEDSEFNNNDETLAAMEFYNSPNEME